MTWTMKKIGFFIITVLSSMLFACSNQNLVSDKEAKEIVDTYDITAFSVVIDTNEQSEVLSASFTEKKDRSEAEYSHKKDEVHLHGKKALDKINDALEKMKPTPETEETELIKQVAEAFEFSDYKMIKIEITFKGHDSKEIMFSK
ncbi:YusW family protein [Sporosarcina saromensis]|uniref:YusW family protein n=1 Tax=Sporosarcina saromensis TaxID=359365 RepID=A0ABU4G4Y5_9BACL|nr:YusW family protein [Sporosarcina saromensis]MDW0112017.1 YusW family protein [Sporosarcina saromensis]